MKTQGDYRRQNKITKEAIETFLSIHTKSWKYTREGLEDLVYKILREKEFKITGEDNIYDLLEYVDNKYSEDEEDLRDLDDIDISVKIFETFYNPIYED